jgi:hypothetical protein
MADRFRTGILILMFGILCAAPSSFAQDASEDLSEAKLGPATSPETSAATMDCAAHPHYRERARRVIRHASKHLINQKLAMYGGGKKFKVKIHRCQTDIVIKDGQSALQTIDVSYDLTWKKRQRFGGKKYYLLLDSQIEGDGSAAAFTLIESSHNLNADFVRAFPLQTQYFNSYNE